MIIKKLRICVDTSVIGGYFDEEFRKDTMALFDIMQKGKVIFVISDLLELELLEAPKRVQDLMYRYSVENFEHIELTSEAMALAESYVSHKVVGKTSIEDCRYIALATLNNVDFLVSWNFKHIVNLDRIKGYNLVNVKYDFPTIEIKSPRDIMKSISNQKFPAQKKFDAVEMMRGKRNKVSKETENMTLAELKKHMQKK